MNNMKRHFFPGGNTPWGFYSFYENILSQEEATRIFCIKGGPGTGKSTVMKDIGKHFEEKGFDIDYLWCSSDPDSLDGVAIRDLSIAVIDGTSPHIVDPKNPGAVDEIVSLGECWNEEMLRINKDRVIELNCEIGTCYINAYKHLKASEGNMKLIEENIAVSNDKELLKQMNHIIKTTFKNKESEGKTKAYFASAITYKGIVNKLDELRKNARLVVALNVPIGIRIDQILENVANTLVNIGCSITKLYCPMNPEKLEHIIVDDGSFVVFTNNDYHSSFNMGENETIALNVEYKFLNKDKYIAARKDFETYIEKAMNYLEEAKRLHDLLEECYIQAMDFNKVKEIKENIIFKMESISY